MMHAEMQSSIYYALMHQKVTKANTESVCRAHICNILYRAGFMAWNHPENEPYTVSIYSPRVRGHKKTAILAQLGALFSSLHQKPWSLLCSYQSFPGEIYIFLYFYIYYWWKNLGICLIILWDSEPSVPFV